MFQQAGDEVLGWDGWHGGDDSDLPGGGVASCKRSTWFGGPGRHFLGKRAAMQPEFGVDLVTFGTRSSEHIS